MLRLSSYTLLLLLAATQCFSRISKEDKKMIRALQADITYLASDALQGRRTGTEGERLAGDYIISFYRKLKIPAFGADYRHPYSFTRGREPGQTSISLNGQSTQMGAGVIPFAFSANGEVNGDVLIDVQEQGAIWALPLYASPDEAANPHFDAEKAAWDKAREAAKTGATGVLFYDSYGSKYAPEFNARSEYDILSIPAAFVTYQHWQQLRSNDANVVSVRMNIRLTKPEYTGNNVIAVIDNKAPLTVVIGAHYDHLGHGEDGGSLYAGKDPQTHNGADDNASGTAALMQLAYWVKANRLKKYNYMFAHFSGEELGLLGSKAFTREPGIDSSHIAYMINMDMIGRLNDSTHALTIGGIGTSPAWEGVVASVRSSGFRINTDSAGIGPSDHTSFYNKGIPVLFFFTGVHADYHKPGDDADKINYAGEASVIRTIRNVVKSLESAPRPAFTPTKQSSMGRVRFKVTLGIIPDYSWQGEGVRADGISEGKPAARAGLRAGDIILRLGNDEVRGMQTYMEALSHQQEGAKTTVTILRDGKKLVLPVEFR
jgi:hypothetical protein